MIIIVFGKTGSGKSFIANILKETYDFHYLEGDDFFTEEMMRIIKADKIISEGQREQFVQSMIDGVMKASREKKHIVLSQLFLSDKARHAVQKAIPEALWIYVDVADTTRYQRLHQRENHFADANYAKKMDEKFEEITINYHKINNNNTAEQILKQLHSIVENKKMIDYQSKFAERTKHIRAGEITKLLAAAARDDVLSLAGGHPARETFPVQEIKKINRYIYEKHSADILQYDLSCGNKILREELQRYLEERNIIVPLEEIGISSGAQNAIDAFAKVLINKGDKIATEFPTFFYSIQTFLMYEPEIVEIRSDREGILPEDFEMKCKKEDIKFLYLIPNFQNPKGSCLSYERRVQILAIAQRYDVIILEDDPYFELRYEGNDIPPMKSLCPENVIYVGSFSKTLSPGMRLGYYVAPEKISSQMTAVRQVDDIHANRYAQILLYEYIHNGFLQKNLKKTKKIYSKRLNIMSENLETYLDTTSFSWEKTQGGLFLWIEGPKNFNAVTAYHECVNEGIAFVPGNFFYKDHKNNNNCIRLNFTNLDEEQLTIAVKKLAKVLNNKALWEK